MNSVKKGLLGLTFMGLISGSPVGILSLVAFIVLPDDSDSEIEDDERKIIQSKTIIRDKDFKNCRIVITDEDDNQD